jgi:hypothetical protein
MADAQLFYCRSTWMGGLVDPLSGSWHRDVIQTNPAYTLGWHFSCGISRSPPGVASIQPQTDFLCTLLFAILPLIRLQGLFLRAASSVEIGYVALSFLYLLIWNIGGKSVGVTPRYWLPMLPFFVVISSLGLQSLVSGVGSR